MNILRQKKLTIFLFLVSISLLFCGREEIINGLVTQNPTLSLARTANPLAFEETKSHAKINLVFPGGQRVIPTYSTGLSLGVEKSLIEP